MESAELPGGRHPRLDRAGKGEALRSVWQQAVETLQQPTCGLKTIHDQVPDFVSKPYETPALLGYALPASAKWFFVYLVMRTLAVMPSRFLMPQPGVSTSIRRCAPALMLQWKSGCGAAATMHNPRPPADHTGLSPVRRSLLFAVTKGLRLSKAEADDGPERARFMRTSIPTPRYGVELGGNTCLVVLISLAFAAVCPLIPLFAIAYFSLEWLYWR